MCTIRMQSNASSSKNVTDICGFRRGSVDGSASPILFEGASFILIEQGSGMLLFNAAERRFSPGCLVSILPWDVVQFQSEEDLVIQTVSYDLFVLNNIIKTAFNYNNAKLDMIEMLERNPVISCDGDALREIQRLFSAIEAECGLDSVPNATSKAYLHNIWLPCKLVELMVVCCRQARNNPDAPAVAAEEEGYAGILRYILSHLSRKITLKSLSTVFGYSEESIQSYLYQNLGLSLNDLISEMRIVRTITYLLYTDLSLEEISAILGFVDSSRLSKVFQARMGDKITAYRKTYSTVNDICKLRNDRKGIDIVSYICRHYQEPLNANDVAVAFSVSVDDMNKLLLYHTEKNFTVFLNTLRVKKACDLLLQTDKTVLDISLEVGYNSIKTFNRQFLRIIGQSPSDYRKIYYPGK